MNWLTRAILLTSFCTGCLCACHTAPRPKPEPRSPDDAIRASARIRLLATRHARKATRRAERGLRSLHQPTYWLAMYGERFEDVAQPYCTRRLIYFPEESERACRDRLNASWHRTFLLDEREGRAHSCEHLTAHIERLGNVMRTQRVPKKKRAKAREWLQLRRYMCLKTITPMLFLLVKDGLWSEDQVTILDTQPHPYRVFRPAPPLAALSTYVDEGDGAGEDGLGESILARTVSLVVRFELEPHSFMEESSKQDTRIEYYDEFGALIYTHHDY